MIKTFCLVLASMSLFAFAPGCAGHDDPEPTSAEETEVQSAAAVGYQCKSVGATCAYAGQCCSANCTAGVCKPPTTCRFKGAFCREQTDCCEGTTCSATNTSTGGYCR